MAGFAADTTEPSVKDGLLCSECDLILNQAVQTFDGIRLCQQCFNDIAELPGSKSTKTGIVVLDEEGKPSCYPDIAVRREVNRLQVICNNKKFGCEWVGELETYFKSHKSLCKYKPVNCWNRTIGCMEEISVQDLERHLKEECQFRKINCQYCGEETIPYHLKEHHEKCLKYPLQCKSCDKILQRNEMAKHKLTECPKVPCLCGETLDREGEGESSVANHLRSPAAVMVHLLSIMTFSRGIMDNIQSMENRLTQLELKHSSNISIPQDYENMSRELTATVEGYSKKMASLESICRTMKASTSKANTTIEVLQKSLTELDKKNKQQELQIQALKAKIEQRTLTSGWGETGRGSGRNNGQDSTRMVLMEKKYEDLERQVASLKVHVSELELQLQASLASTHNGAFLWRIPDILRRRRDAVEERVTSIYSPPFYTGRNGYKMCIRAYLNGDGMGYKTHFSLFFVLMKGEFDPLLKWPFDYKVSLILVDQNHRKHIVQTFKPTSESSSFQRPVSDMNVASGCPQFTKLTALEDENYVKDDVIFIKCIIDTSRIFHP